MYNLILNCPFVRVAVLAESSWVGANPTIILVYSFNLGSTYQPINPNNAHLEWLHVCVCACASIVI